MATNRSALERYKKQQGINTDDEAAVKEAERTYRSLPLLHNDALRKLAYKALGAAYGPAIDAQTPFPAMIWTGGARHTKDGVRFVDTVGGFVKLLDDRAAAVAPKREGWVIEPTTNTDGHRTNASTTAVHALFLDCDGAGPWEQLLAILFNIDYALVAYQSGGWSPTTPKWRIVLPLTRPFDTSTDEKRAAWKQVYHHCRIIFGALGGLLGAGFDPMTDTPCCPWFLTERRQVTDSPRQVTWKPGHSLDLMSLVMALPPVEEETRPTTATRVVKPHGLSNEQLDSIITALSKATAHVPSGRHELYLALPGVLLDRGVPADEVLAIIEEVSASYPRSHPEHHKDNLHNAQTTINKFEAGGHYTRIGELNSRWPEIAQALDKVLPNPMHAALQEATETMLAAPAVIPGATPAKKKRRKLSPLGKLISPISAHMKKSSNTFQQFGGVLIERILDGDSFQSPGATPAEVDGLVGAAMLALGFNLPKETTWREVLDLSHQTLLSMDFTQSIERVAAAEQSFLKGQRQRQKWNAKKQAAIDEQKSHAAAIRAAALAKGLS